MDIFRAHYADMTDAAWQSSLVTGLRDNGLVTFAGITDRAALIAVARRLTCEPQPPTGPAGQMRAGDDLHGLGAIYDSPGRTKAARNGVYSASGIIYHVAARRAVRCAVSGRKGCVS